jgi:hypothetical protein
VVVQNQGEVLKLLEQGNAVRHVASTKMNGRSSRSHSCFTVKVKQPRPARCQPRSFDARPYLSSLSDRAENGQGGG